MKSQDDTKYEEAVAETTHDLIKEGNTGPHIEEIAERHYGDHVMKQVTKDRHAEDVREVLSEIVRLLEKDYGVVSCLSSQRYHDEYKYDLPTDATGARICLPLGRGKRGVGLHVRPTKDDEIYKAWTAHLFSCAKGKRANQMKKIERDLATGDMDESWEKWAFKVLYDDQREARALPPNVQAFLNSKTDQLKLGEGDQPKLELDGETEE